MPSEIEQARAKINLTWQDVIGLAKDLENSIRMTGQPVEAVLSIGRGGAIPARLMSEAFNVPMYFLGLAGFNDVYQPLTASTQDELNPLGPRLLIVDDLWDSGQTIKTVSRWFPFARIGTLLCKMEHPLEVDFTGAIQMAEDWVVFPWEKG